VTELRTGPSKGAEEDKKMKGKAEKEKKRKEDAREIPHRLSSRLR